MTMFYKKRLASWKSCKMSEMHMGALVAMSKTSEVLVNNLVGSMVESQPGTVEVAFPNSGAAAMPGREQGWSLARGQPRDGESWRVQGPPRLDDASSWPIYKKRFWKAYKMSEMHIGALVAMSRISVDNTQVYSYSSFVCFMCCFRVHLLPSQQVPLGTRKFWGQVSTAVYILVCSRLQIYKKDAMVCSVCAFFLWLKMPSRELSFWPPPPYIFENG